MSSTPTPTERSVSRGREPVYSSGRGGAGNIRPGSASRGPASQPGRGPDDFSPARGRELVDRREEVTTTGRGGAGNIRSQSRDSSAAIQGDILLERQHTKEREASNVEQIYSTGRGGAGNMSRSRSRSREPSLHAPANALSPVVRAGLLGVHEGRPSFELSKLEEEDKRSADLEDVVKDYGAPVREHGAGNMQAATTAAY